jgi:hypothetical protein
MYGVKLNVQSQEGSKQNAIESFVTNKGYNNVLTCKVQIKRYIKERQAWVLQCQTPTLTLNGRLSFGGI